MRTTIENLIRKSRSNRYIVRKYAILAFRKTNKIPSCFYGKIMEILVQSLGDSNGEVRKEALLSLESLIEQDPAQMAPYKDLLVKEMNEYLNHRDPLVRTMAIHILTNITILDSTNGRVHGAALLSKITGMLEDQNPKVRLEAFKSISRLSQIGANIQTSVDNLVQYLLQEERFYLNRIRNQRDSKCAENMKKRRQSMLEVFDAMVRGGEKLGIRISFILGLLQFLDDPDHEDGEILVSLLGHIYSPGDSHFQVHQRMEVVKKLVYYGMHTQNEKVERAVGHALQRIFSLEPKDSEVLKHFFLPPQKNEKKEENLFYIAFHPNLDAQKRFWGAKFLGIIFAKAEIPSTVVSFLEEKLENPSQALLALAVMREMGRYNSQFSLKMKNVILQLAQGDKHEDFQKEGMKTLSRLKLTSEEALQVSQRLLEILEKGSPALKIVAARSLEKMANLESSLHEKFLSLLLHLSLQEGPFSRNFAEILGGQYLHLKEVSSDLVQKIFKGLEQKSEEVQENALWLLSILSERDGHLNFSPHFDTFYSLYNNTTNPFLKRTILETLLALYKHVSMEEKRIEILEIFIQALEEPHLMVSEGALLSLESLFQEAE
ncbi:MAG: hypothetical protein D6785_04535 [Planctomycetota bacterium]|nr:MAG: hypothetical protein D6785_04535 [Planctomycetota bacterium]